MMFQRAYWGEDDETALVIQSVQDEKPVLELNKFLQNAGDGFTPSRDMQHVASIPLVLVEKWLREEGINIFDKNHWPAVARKLNSSEYRWLRTSPGKV